MPALIGNIENRKTEKTKNRKTELLLKYAEIPQEIIQEKENGNF